MRRLLTILLIVAVVGAAGVAPGPTYYISRTGNDTTGDGSAATPWKTFGKFTSSATTGDTLYAKAGTYTEQDGSSNAVFAPTSATLTVIGYNTTTDTLDGTIGCVILDAGGESLANGLKSNYPSTSMSFLGRYLRFTGASSHGADFATNNDRIVALKDCIFNNNGAYGLYAGQSINVIDSKAFNNTSRGLYLNGPGMALRCVSSENGSDGIYAYDNDVIECVSHDNAVSQIYAQPGIASGILKGCVVDGGGSVVGFNIDSVSHLTELVNCIIYNCTYGVTASASPRGIGQNNLYFSNTADTDGDWVVADSSITGQDPLFVNPAINDYRLGAGSPALEAGIDVGSIDGITSTSFIDIGALQAEPTGGTTVIVIDD